MFGDYIKQLRATKGMGSRELSRSVNKAETYISQLERGLIKKPDFETAKQILEELGLTSHRVGEIISAYEIQENAISIEKIKKITITQEDFDNRCKKDALEVFNLVNSLPTKTQEFLKELLYSELMGGV
jgi:transcriptional regulator with XRE-family HTH domain